MERWKQKRFWLSTKHLEMYKILVLNINDQ